MFKSINYYLNDLTII